MKLTAQSVREPLNVEQHEVVGNGANPLCRHRRRRRIFHYIILLLLLTFFQVLQLL